MSQSTTLKISRLSLPRATLLACGTAILHPPDSRNVRLSRPNKLLKEDIVHSATSVFDSEHDVSRLGGRSQGDSPRRGPRKQMIHQVRLESISGKGSHNAFRVEVTGEITHTEPMMRFRHKNHMRLEDCLARLLLVFMDPHTPSRGSSNDCPRRDPSKCQPERLQNLYSRAFQEGGTIGHPHLTIGSQLLEGDEIPGKNSSGRKSFGQPL